MLAGATVSRNTSVASHLPVVAGYSANATSHGCDDVEDGPLAWKLPSGR